jgi:hypothetical protein
VEDGACALVEVEGVHVDPRGARGEALVHHLGAEGDAVRLQTLWL